MFIFFLLGLAIGSFLNVVINRTESGEDVVSEPSHCPKCRKKLLWYELVPLFSFVVQIGKCRGCGQRISSQYPLVELFTGVFFALAYSTLFSSAAVFGADFLTLLKFGWLLLAVSFFIIIFVYDFKTYIIPDRFVYPAIALAFIYNAAVHFLRPCDFSLACPVWNDFFAAGLGFGFFFFLIVLSRGRWMGGGDAKLVIFMGLVLGWPKILAALFLAFFVGSIVGLTLIAFRKKGLQSQIPFGPLLAGASLVVLFFGEGLINWYLGLLGF